MMYCRQRHRKDVTDWWCTVRRRGCRCPATVQQRSDHFQHGKHPHTHEPQPGVAQKLVIKKQVSMQNVRDYLSYLHWNI